MGWHNQSNRFCDRSRDVAMVTDCWCESAKIGISQPSFCALAFHTGWEDRNKDARVNTADDSFKSVKNLAKFGPVTPEFCRRVCAGRATRWDLPRISSL